MTTANMDKKILKKLEALEKKEGALAGPLDFYRKLLSIQLDTKRHTGKPRFSLSPETINERINAGRPLLEFDKLPVDWSLFEDTFKKIGALFASYSRDGAGTDWKQLSAGSSLKEAARAWFEGAPPSFLMAESNANTTLWEHVIQAAFNPFLIAYRDSIYSQVNQEYWRRSYCPVCGGSPDFAFLDKERGSRYLVCSRCDTEWIFQRLACPFCGTQNQSSLTYFSDDKGLYRLYVCDECQCYLKAIDLRQTEDEILMPLERLLTLDLDIQAQEKGYKPVAKARDRVGAEEGREDQYKKANINQ